MPERIRVACLERAEALTARAASTGADVVVLPEKWNLIGSADDYRAGAGPLEGGASMQAMSGWETIAGKPAYGRSLIADPWGIVLRAKLPSLANRRPAAYRAPDIAPA